MTDLRLNDAERRSLKALYNLTAGMDLDRPDHWIEVNRPSAEFRQAIDILVLSGLAERREDPCADPFGPRGWLDQWRLTEAGIETADLQPQTSLFTS